MGKYLVGQILDLTGHKYGKLTAIRRVDRQETPPRSYWECECGAAVIEDIFEVEDA